MGCGQYFHGVREFHWFFPSSWPKIFKFFSLRRPCGRTQSHDSQPISLFLWTCRTHILCTYFSEKFTWILVWFMLTSICSSVYTPCTDSSSLYHTNTLKPSDNEGSDTPPRHPFCHHCHYLPLTLKLRTNPHLHPSAMWAANKWHTPNV